ncbi:Hypothetical predicted protein [Pelobates cultripes]|uniref:Uncharacterized protein n=1 Tax=Pelobates cultripes TaxID=61616 RepID=A0AAD1T4L7_PELCU|nr:Hypothetical predicted protein [Pelobates cultripes]
MKDDKQKLVKFRETNWQQQKFIAGNQEFNQELVNWRPTPGKMKMKRPQQVIYQSNFQAKSGIQVGKPELRVFQKKRRYTDSYRGEMPWHNMMSREQNYQFGGESPRNDVWQAGKRGKWDYNQGMKNESPMSHGGKRRSGRGWGDQINRGKQGFSHSGRQDLETCPIRSRMTMKELDEKLAAYTINTEVTNKEVNNSSVEDTSSEKMEIDMPIVESLPEPENFDGIFNNHGHYNAQQFGSMFTSVKMTCYVEKHF